MKRAILIILLGGAAAAYFLREDIERLGVKVKWKAPDGRGLLEVLKQTRDKLYGGDLFGDGRKDHKERIDILEKEGLVTYNHGVNNQNNGGAILTNFSETDVGTKQYLAQTECRIAVRDYGLDPKLEKQCQAEIVSRGVYSFKSNGLDMAVSILPGVTSGKPTKVSTGNQQSTDSSNWTEG